MLTAGMLTALSRPTNPDGRNLRSLLSLSSGRNVSKHSSIFASVRHLTVSAHYMDRNLWQTCNMIWTRPVQVPTDAVGPHVSEQDFCSSCYAKSTGQQGSKECSPLASHASLASPTHRQLLTGPYFAACLQQLQHSSSVLSRSETWYAPHCRGAEKHKRCKVTEETDTAHCFHTDNYHEGLGKHSPSLIKLNLQRNSTLGHKLLLGPRLALCSGVVATGEIYVSLSCPVCVKAPTESDLQFAHGLHIAFQVGSGHCTKQPSPTGSHFSERVKTFGIASCWHSARLYNLHQRKAMYALLVSSAAVGSEVRECALVLTSRRLPSARTTQEPRDLTVASPWLTKVRHLVASSPYNTVCTVISKQL